MSVEAITWALGLKIDRSSTKFVLVAMANCANNDMECWPSIQYLSDATCQDRKTVLENIKRLKESGHISDTGMRRGHTGQVHVYLLNKSENGTVKESQNRNSTENGTVPKTQGNSPVFPMKESRFSVETVPKTGHGTVKEPSIEPKGNQIKRACASACKPDDVPDSVWQDFSALRRSKRAPLTQTALTGIEREAAKAGISLQTALETCCQRGWTGLKAEWLANPSAASVPRAEKFDPVAYVNRNRARSGYEPASIIDITPQRMA